MIKKNIFLVCVALFLVLFFLILVSAEEVSEDPFDINTFIDLGQDESIQYTETTKIGGGDVQFGESGSLNFEDGASFENVDSSEPPSYVHVSPGGDITSAGFYTDEEGGTYLFGNREVVVPPNSQLIFDNNTGITIIAADNSKLESLPDTSIFVSEEVYEVTLVGNNLVLPDGSVLNKGKLVCDMEFCYIKGESKSVINGFTINAGSEDVVTLFDESCGSEMDCVNIEEDYIEVSGSDFEVSFSSNYFVKAVDSALEDFSFSNSNNKKFFRRGDEGEDVKVIQTIVGIPETGVYDRTTVLAVKKWQRVNGLYSDGSFGGQSMNKVSEGLDASRIIAVTPLGGSVEISRENSRLGLSLFGESNIRLGSESLEIRDEGLEGFRVYKKIKSEISLKAKVPVDLVIHDSEGNEVANYLEVPGPGSLETLGDFISDGVKNKGYFTSKYKTSIHANTVVFDDVPEDEVMINDRLIRSNTVVENSNLNLMSDFSNSLPMDMDPDERFNSIVRKAGEVSNYNPELAIKLISIFGSRYKDLSPNPQEGYSNVHLVNGRDSSIYKRNIPPISSKVAENLGVTQDVKADKKYRLILVAGQLLHNPDEGALSIALEHTFYELEAFAGSIIRSFSSEESFYGSGDFGDITADWAGADFGDDLYESPRETLENFNVTEYLD
jgi:peptidoglycan hydrolase-like protein with peptidoglycan-binding domain